LDNQKLGSMRVRVGRLIENYIINKHNLLYNKRQHSQHRGYYDAYNKYTIYEIKGIRYDKNAKVLMIKNNHIELMNRNGKYIFVIYELSKQDKNLQVITDIKIKDEIILDAKIVNNLISGEWKKKNGKKIYCRVLLSKIWEENKNVT